MTDAAPPPSRTEPSDARDASGHADGRFATHARTVMALTMGSRLSGLAREAVCARMFGVHPLWSAWVTAFVVPNLFRRLFGEGAISAAFIPEYARLAREDPARAARLASLTVAGVTVVVGTIVLLAEIVLIGMLLGPLASPTAPGRGTALFLAIMLPYAPLVCGSAMLGGMLQTHGRFAQLAGGPIIVNVCITIAAWVAARTLGLSIESSILWLSISVLIGGIGQLGWSIWALRALVHWTRDVADVWSIFVRMLGRMVPVILGMATLQLGTVIDTVIAGIPVTVGPNPDFLGGAAYPLDKAAASVLFFAQRLYQFPLGVFGIAIATVAFPALARQASRPEAFLVTMRRGIRLGAFIGIPASIGLVMVARSMVNVVYLGGAFDPATAARVAGVLAAYAPAVVAYSIIHVLTRSFYASGVMRAPMIAGIVTVLVNAIGSVTLMWPLQERGLAVATSVASFLQLAILLAMAPRRIPACAGRSVIDGDTARSLLASVMVSGAMVVAIILGGLILPVGGAGWMASALDLTRDVAIGGAVYLGGAIALHRPEVRWLIERRVPLGSKTSGAESRS